MPLTDEGAAEGFALACQAVPNEDLVIGVAASAAMCTTEAQSFDARIAEVQQLSGSTLAFVLEGTGPIGCLPGQLRQPARARNRDAALVFLRCPGDGGLSFLIRDIPEGQMSGFIRAAGPGTEIDFTGPSGSFYLRDMARPVLFLAGGIDLAPFLSMLRLMQEKGASSQPVHLVYGVTRDEDLVEVAALEALAALPGFSFTTVVADPASAHPRKGYVTDHLGAGQLNDGEIDVYLCGPPPMADAVRGWLAAQG
jgi:benzoate/toluate 1,2-dioxygenase reductase component